MTAKTGLLATALSTVFVLTSSLANAALPSSFTHNTRYKEANGSFTYWTSGSESYVKDTLPHEWLLSWNLETWKAGAVIIRSGVYWRINRSVLGSGWPNNNCYQGIAGGFKYYRTAPNTRGYQEEWHPNSSNSATNQAVDQTYRYHAQLLSTPSGRPDPFVALRYAAGLQTRTYNASGTWVSKIRSAYLNQGNPYDPNSECSQVDDQTSSNPAYPNN